MRSMGRTILALGNHMDPETGPGLVYRECFFLGSVMNLRRL